MRIIIPVIVAFLLPASGCVSANQTPAPRNPEPVSFETKSGIKVHVVQTGWISVKEHFRELSGPAMLRVPSIVLDSDWTEWMPIQFYVIEHPDGIAVFDTGETAKVHEPGYFNCRPGNEWFYRNQLKFAVNSEDELGPQLKLLGLDAKNVRWAILSHLHSDHMGGMYHLKNAQFYISANDWLGHQGDMRCQIPIWVEPTLVDYRHGEFGAFAESQTIDEQGTLRVVPTPGHTEGHQSLISFDRDTYYFFAGDVVFDLERLNNRKAVAGIAENISAAKASIKRVTTQLEEFDTILAPAHDRGVRENRF
ncbi:MAG: MBL fold metallo-hydrolase [Pseudomonadota bacterium]